MESAIAQGIACASVDFLRAGTPCYISECDDAFYVLSCVHCRLFPLYVCADVRRRMRRWRHCVLVVLDRSSLNFP